MNPSIVATARTARLVREARTPVYSTVTPTAAARKAAVIAKAEGRACLSDYCFVCNRCTEHFGEHSEEQILAWARTPRGIRMMRGL